MFLSRGSSGDRRVLVDRRGLGCPVGLEVAEHGEDDVAAAAGEADDCGVVLLALGALSVVFAFESVERSDANAARNMAFLSRWFPRRDWDSPRMLVPDWRVTGASPA